MDNIILLSDHTWFHVEDKKQAREFINCHNWEGSFTVLRYGIYISVGQKIIMPYTEGEKSK